MIVTIPWKKHAKQRPRTVRGGHTFTPKATKEAEAIIADNFKAAVPQDFEPFTGPLYVGIQMSAKELSILIVPMDSPESKALNGDIDNYLKTILDALNGVAWVDDKQIRAIYGVKS